MKMPDHLCDGDIKDQDQDELEFTDTSLLSEEESVNKSGENPVNEDEFQKTIMNFNKFIKKTILPCVICQKKSFKFFKALVKIAERSRIRHDGLFWCIIQCSRDRIPFRQGSYVLVSWHENVKKNCQETLSDVMYEKLLVDANSYGEQFMIHE